MKEFNDNHLKEYFKYINAKLHYKKHIKDCNRVYLNSMYRYEQVYLIY